MSQPPRGNYDYSHPSLPQQQPNHIDGQRPEHFQQADTGGAMGSYPQYVDPHQVYAKPHVPHGGYYSPGKPITYVSPVEAAPPRLRPQPNLEGSPSRSKPGPLRLSTHPSTISPLPLTFIQQQQLLRTTSPYATPTGMVYDGGSGSSVAPSMADYFSPFPTSTTSPQPIGPAYPPTWHFTPPIGGSQAGRSTAGTRTPGSGAGPKTNRQQFTACGACRHRRVKCDLKDRQESAESWPAAAQASNGVGPQRSASSSKVKRVSCSNCVERGMNCVDEYAPVKAAKQLRRGKRISEMESLYGRNPADMTAVFRSPEGSMSPKGKGVDIPDLTPAFFDSPFFRRFQIQRPLLDPVDFVQRYLSSPVPTASAMGAEGCILCYVLYAWALSYGVDENGQLDVPEGGAVPIEFHDMRLVGESEMRREADRQRRRSKMLGVLEVILRSIDELAIMRKPTWDGVRCLLLVLPLTEGFSSTVERLAMYETAISQVYMLCSFAATGYDGMPSGVSAHNGGSDDARGTSIMQIRTRVYWYTFVHEGITTGLKGGRLHLDDSDIDTMQDPLQNRALVLDTDSLWWNAKFATAPINLALSCRLINRALTGPLARRRQGVDAEAVKAAWEALEISWEEFDSFRYSPPDNRAYTTQDEVSRFADGWKIFLFEAQNVIRKNLEERLSKLAVEQSSAHITSAHGMRALPTEFVNIQHLLEIAKSKCDVKTKQIMEIVRQHIGTTFFEWDASLVRDGTFYAAMLLAKNGGSDKDISLCLQALNELRWAHAKAWERSAELRAAWQETVSSGVLPGPPERVVITGWDPSFATPLEPTRSIRAPYTSGISIKSEPALGIPSILTSHSEAAPNLNASIFDDSDGLRRYIPSVASTSSSAQLYPGPLPDLHEWPVDRNSANGAEAYGLYARGDLQWLGHSLSPGIEHNVLWDGDRQQPPMGQYVLQPDGTHIFVSYAAMPDGPIS